MRQGGQLQQNVDCSVASAFCQRNSQALQHTERENTVRNIQLQTLTFQLYKTPTYILLTIYRWQTISIRCNYKLILITVVKGLVNITLVQYR